MPSKPEVSVVMPAYNAEKYIGAAIESILTQTFNQFELIIVNDASTDNTKNIISSFSKQDPRIIVIQNETNLGIAGSRNRGLQTARGKYIAWQDADDLSCGERLEKQYAFMENNPAVAIVGAYLEFFDETGSLHVRKYATEDHALRCKIFRYSPVAQPVAMIRKKCVDEAGEYDLRYPPAEDIDMSFRLGMKYQFANIPEVLLKYRQHLESATFIQFKIMEGNTLKIRKKYFGQAAFKVTLFDRLFNLIQKIMLDVIPPRIKIRLFNLVRNRNVHH